MMTLAERIESVRERIARSEEIAGAEPGSVSLVAVTKTIPVGIINEAVALGLNVLGENRVQEWMEKSPEISGNISWNMIGQLQKNKVKYIIGKVYCIQSLDRLSLASEIQRQASMHSLSVRALLEVNIGDEDQKGGVPAAEARSLLEQIGESCPLVRIEGLMGVAPDVGAEASRPYFAKLKRLFDKLSGAGIPNVTMQTLSMGMTGDFEAAILEGSNMVRIGSAIFGAR